MGDKKVESRVNGSGALSQFLAPLAWPESRAHVSHVVRFHFRVKIDSVLALSVAAAEYASSTGGGKLRVVPGTLFRRAPLGARPICLGLMLGLCEPLVKLRMRVTDLDLSPKQSKFWGAGIQ